MATPTTLVVLDPHGREVWRAQAPPGMDIASAAISLDGDRVATVLVSKSGERSELALLGPGGHRRTLFQGLGRFDEVVYSPDGEWLLLTWRSADQWLFVNPRSAPGRRRSPTSPPSSTRARPRRRLSPNGRLVLLRPDAAIFSSYEGIRGHVGTYRSGRRVLGE